MLRLDLTIFVFVCGIILPACGITENENQRTLSEDGAANVADANPSEAIEYLDPLTKSGSVFPGVPDLTSKIFLSQEWYLPEASNGNLSEFTGVQTRKTLELGRYQINLESIGTQIYLRIEGDYSIPVTVQEGFDEVKSLVTEILKSNPIPAGTVAGGVYREAR